MESDPELSFTLSFVVTVVNMTWKLKKNVTFISVKVTVTVGVCAGVAIHSFFFFSSPFSKKLEELH